VIGRLARTLKVALVGCGRIASYAHLPCYKKLPGVEVVSVMDVVKEKAQLTARTFGVKKWYSSYKEMLKDSEIQAVDICSPPHMHAQQAIDAAESGKHVLCEKPIATNLQDAMTLQSVIRRTGIKFMTGFTYRFHPLVQKAREEVVMPKLLRISYSFRPGTASDHWVHDLNKSGGFIVEQAVHWFDLLRWFSGKAKSVYAKGQINPPAQSVVATISCENDMLGLVDFNANSPQFFFILTVENAEKSAMLRMELLPNKRGGLLQISESSGKRRSYFINSLGHDKTWREASFPVSLVMSRILDCHLIPFSREIEHFVQSIQKDSLPQVSIDHGVDSLKVATAVKDSIEKGKETPII
jgi:predicted dehydrogenase